ncbi:MAG: radical SAM family heme chaperone HemW [Sphingobacteriales bacterium]|nr:MAG: radical SAM family heme chaperone HemW [Sphingobacteriales bacterium]
MAGIYLHIPFCRQACTYCNFHFSTSLKYKDDVLHAMHKELELQRNFLAGLPVETIYFGGGTPSLLSADELNRLFEHIFQLFPVNELKECTLEANPDDLTNAYLKSLRSTPVNRFSIGVQSFKDSDLRYMNRAHNAGQADYAIKAAQDAGFTNITIDLIYGTPGLTDADWKHNLKQVRELQLPHFSSYALTVEENTALHHKIKTKKTAPVDNEQSAAQFEILMEQAEAMGFEHYEISNFAKPFQYAVHNTNYWKGLPYLGIGPSAHSFDGENTRSWNIANNATYAKALLQDGKRAYEEEKLTQEEHLNEYIMTSLRTMWGCDLAKIAGEWGHDQAKDIEKSSAEYQERNWVVVKDDKLILTPAGKLFADRIAGDLFV